MRKRTVKSSNPNSTSPTTKMASNRGYYNEDKQDDDDYRSNNTKKSRGIDMVDGPRSLGQTSQNFSTTTTVSSPSGFRLAQHMTIAGSFLDFALFVADVEHLKFLLDAGEDNIKYFKMLIGLLITSLVLQLIVVFLLFIVGFKKPKGTTVTTRNTDNIPLDDPNQLPPISSNEAHQGNNTIIEEVVNNGESTLLNHVIICLVTIIAIINVFVTVFGDRSATTMIDTFKRDAAARALNATAH